MKAARVLVQVSIVGGLGLHTGSILGALGFGIVAVLVGLVG